MLIAASTALLALFNVAASPGCADLFPDDELERWSRWSESREWRASGEINLSRTESGHRLLKSFVLVGLSPGYRAYAMTEYEPVYFIEEKIGVMSFGLNQVDGVENKGLSCFFSNPGVLYISRPVGAVVELNMTVFGISDFNQAMGFAKKLHLLPAVNDICAVSLGKRHAKLKSEEFGVYGVEYGGWAAFDAKIFPGGELEIVHEVESSLERIEGKIRVCED